jgi:glutathione S-transferase
MAEFKLHGFFESGNAYKVAMMLEMTGVDWEVIPTRFFQGETRDPGWRDQFNELGEVPVLQHKDEALSQSGVILDYLAAVTGKFGAASPGEQREVWRWILFDNHKFTANLATLRYLIQFAKTGETPVTEFLRARCINAMKIVDLHLAERPFITGERPTIADLSMLGYLYYGDELTVPLGDFGNIRRWTDRVKAMPGWKHPYEMMPGGPGKTVR